MEFLGFDSRLLLFLFLVFRVVIDNHASEHATVIQVDFTYSLCSYEIDIHLIVEDDWGFVFLPSF